jgi:transcriptional regulator with XRE-family HTH domain
VGIGARLKEERNRLGLSQAEFAAVAGASKGAQLKWEKEESSPTATILTAWAEAGADALYILTGQRTDEAPAKNRSDVEAALALIRHDILGSSTNDERFLSVHRGELCDMLGYPGMPSEIREQAQSLLAVLQDPEKIAAWRAADYAQLRKKRDDIKRQLEALLAGPYIPNLASLQSMMSMIIDYDVPTVRMALLAEQLHEDITEQRTSGTG